VSPRSKVQEKVTIPTNPEPSIKRETDSMDVHITPTESNEYSKEVKFLEVIELKPDVIQALVSDHIINGIINCAIKGIKIERGKRK